MKDEKQTIEEMARIICKPTANKGNCDKCGFKKQCSKFDDATDLYNAGYHKQIEGEWKLGKSGVMYFCSSCGYAAHPREEEEWNFCPRCGAKMKGGAE